MSVNPLVAAIAAFGQGEEKGRELKRRGERDFQADVQAQRNAERQSMLDKAQQAFQQFQMQAPERAEQQRVKVQGEQDTRNASRQQAAHSMIAQRFGPQESGGEFRPDFDYAAHYDNLLANLRAQEQAKAAAERAGMSEDRRDERQMRGFAAIADRQSSIQARPPRPPTEGQEKSAIYLGLMDNALPTIDATVKDIRPEVMAMVRKDPTKIGTAALTVSERRFFRAAREFAAAVLRKETGATIRPEEIVDVIDRYIDTGFDDPMTRADKAAARKNYRDLMERSARPAIGYYETGDTRGRPSPPTPDRTNKYRTP